MQESLIQNILKLSKFSWQSYNDFIEKEKKNNEYGNENYIVNAYILPCESINTNNEYLWILSLSMDTLISMVNNINNNYHTILALINKGILLNKYIGANENADLQWFVVGWINIGFGYIIHSYNENIFNYYSKIHNKDERTNQVNYNIYEYVFGLYKDPKIINDINYFVQLSLLLLRSLRRDEILAHITHEKYNNNDNSTSNIKNNNRISPQMSYSQHSDNIINCNKNNSNNYQKKNDEYCIRSIYDKMITIFSTSLYHASKMNEMTTIFSWLLFYKPFNYYKNNDNNSSYINSLKNNNDNDNSNDNGNDNNDFNIYSTTYDSLSIVSKLLNPQHNHNPHFILFKLFCPLGYKVMKIAAQIIMSTKNNSYLNIMLSNSPNQVIINTYSNDTNILSNIEYYPIRYKRAPIPIWLFCNGVAENRNILHYVRQFINTKNNFINNKYSLSMIGLLKNGLICTSEVDSMFKVPKSIAITTLIPDISMDNNNKTSLIQYKSLIALDSTSSRYIINNNKWSIQKSNEILEDNEYASTYIYKENYSPSNGDAYITGELEMNILNGTVRHVLQGLTYDNNWCRHTFETIELNKEHNKRLKSIIFKVVDLIQKQYPFLKYIEKDYESAQYNIDKLIDIISNYSCILRLLHTECDNINPHVNFINSSLNFHALMSQKKLHLIKQHNVILHQYIKSMYTNKDNSRSSHHLIDHYILPLLMWNDHKINNFLNYEMRYYISNGYVLNYILNDMDIIHSYSSVNNNNLHHINDDNNNNKNNSNDKNVLDNPIMMRCGPLNDISEDVWMSWNTFSREYNIVPTHILHNDKMIIGKSPQYIKSLFSLKCMENSHTLYQSDQEMDNLPLNYKKQLLIISYFHHQSAKNIHNKLYNIDDENNDDDENDEYNIKSTNDDNFNDDGDEDDNVINNSYSRPNLQQSNISDIFINNYSFENNLGIIYNENFYSSSSSSRTKKCHIKSPKLLPCNFVPQVYFFDDFMFKEMINKFIDVIDFLKFIIFQHNNNSTNNNTNNEYYSQPLTIIRNYVKIPMSLVVYSFPYKNVNSESNILSMVDGSFDEQQHPNCFYYGFSFKNTLKEYIPKYYFYYYNIKINEKGFIINSLPSEVNTSFYYIDSRTGKLYNHEKHNNKTHIQNLDLKLNHYFIYKRDDLISNVIMWFNLLQERPTFIRYPPIKHNIDFFKNTINNNLHNITINDDVNVPESKFNSLYTNNDDRKEINNNNNININTNRENKAAYDYNKFELSDSLKNIVDSVLPLTQDEAKLKSRNLFEPSNIILNNNVSKNSINNNINDNDNNNNNNNKFHEKIITSFDNNNGNSNNSNSNNNNIIENNQDKFVSLVDSVALNKENSNQSETSNEINNYENNSRKKVIFKTVLTESNRDDVEKSVLRIHRTLPANLTTLELSHSQAMKLEQRLPPLTESQMDNLVAFPEPDPDAQIEDDYDDDDENEDEECEEEEYDEDDEDDEDEKDEDDEDEEEEKNEDDNSNSNETKDVFNKYNNKYYNGKKEIYKNVDTHLIQDEKKNNYTHQHKNKNKKEYPNQTDTPAGKNNKYSHLTINNSIIDNNSYKKTNFNDNNIATRPRNGMFDSNEIFDYSNSNYSSSSITNNNIYQIHDSSSQVNNNQFQQHQNIARPTPESDLLYRKLTFYNGQSINIFQKDNIYYYKKKNGDHVVISLDRVNELEAKQKIKPLQ